ncbi:hypothetical protein [Novosphingobium sp. BL-52-GroH]|uniref:hypothetical protein n=1 Tax=Novosphingobium sp. BL-52-GroH TaxID=3349877 RepID=UPI00384B97C0
MLDNIWHLRGSTHIGNTSGEEALDQIEALLDQQRKPLTEERVGYRAFHTSLFENAFGPSWLSMVAYEKGAFWIEESTQGRILKYDLRSLHALIFCVVAAGIFFLFGFANDGVAGSARYATFAFLWLYGGNMLLAWIRIPRAIRKAVRAKGN